MVRRSVAPLYRGFFGVLTLAAITTQLVAASATPTFSPVNYFSYFTIDSNLVAAAVLLIGAAVRQRSRTLDLLRGAAVVYMVVVGVVFTLLLSGTDVDTAIPWVNTVVHELMPMVMVADWLLDPPAHRLSLRQSLLWLSFPFVWILYTLVRGAITGRYPYPFLNPTNGGYGSVAAYSAAIFVLLMVVCAVVVWIGNAPRPSGLLPSPGS
ncbi:MAG: hypothetical protein DLM67_19135 [Candidatus Nephthysia bennettiae]|uniref:Pr6Pr family membrane protein n=1 Tax=Candidatus Nephthysia bennettiae TaxID=3127016 RepID=A0A934KA66_9BACT|nr:Pr6Pr family membrane protein [Candidatus Dormibacteraeota bacterium]MBJ7613903.1 Pr6Pr family membrane protein [Candidatus Dormibacteraeota bacterium]PZR89409.1 MAG: hypothetical protein DLM67_19135 [Candidatus Dormibacteraeota bacterium]